MKHATRKWLSSLRHRLKDLLRRRVTLPILALLLPVGLLLLLVAAQLCRMTELQASVDDIRDRADAIESRLSDLAEMPPGQCGDPYDDEAEPDPNYLDI